MLGEFVVNVQALLSATCEAILLCWWGVAKASSFSTNHQISFTTGRTTPMATFFLQLTTTKAWCLVLAHNQCSIPTTAAKPHPPHRCTCSFRCPCPFLTQRGGPDPQSLLVISHPDALKAAGAKGAKSRATAAAGRNGKAYLPEMLFLCILRQKMSWPEKLAVGGGAGGVGGSGNKEGRGSTANSTSKRRRL